MADRTCALCGKVFKYPAFLKRHHNSVMCHIEEVKAIKLKDDAKQYECPKCNFKSLYMPNFSRHKKTCKGVGAKPEPQNEEEHVSITSVILKLQQQLALLVTQQQLQQQNPVPSQNTMVQGDLNQNTMVQGDLNQNTVHGDLNQNTQNNTIQNNTIVNLVNPFGYESISNISLDKLPSIFINVDQITEKLCDVMYANPVNKNFFKVNIKLPNVTMLTYDLKLKSMQEDRFIKDFFINIVFNYFIRIIHEYKNKLSIEDFSSYMKKAIIYEKIARNIDMDDPHDKIHIEIIKGYINDFSRDKEIQAKIKDTLALITKEEHVRDSLFLKLDEQNIPTILQEYSVKDHSLTYDERAASRNLYHYKKEFGIELLRDQNPDKNF